MSDLAEDPRITAVRAYAADRIRRGSASVTAIRIGSDLLNLLGENENGSGVRAVMDGR